jgi:hypothetical protein
MGLSQEQKAELWRAKLHSLARDHFGRTEGTDHPMPWGAALELDGVWTALLEVAPERSFGQALVLAARNQAQSLDLLVESDAASVARRAQLFDPSPSVWIIDGTELAPAEASVPKHVTAAAIEPKIAALLDVDDVDVIIEHGVIIGECRGLEVARVTGAGAEQRLDVGVGAYDQGAFVVMNPHLTPDEALGNVVDQVMDFRRRGGEPHPINRLARERWVRTELLAEPLQIGMASLEVVEPMTPREGIKDIAIAAAVGVAATGERVLVACTVGIDLDAVPAAADLAAQHGADRIMIVLPDRDRHPIVQAVADQSRLPIEFVSAPEPWSE